MKLAALCDADTAMGLRLAGIQNLYITDNDELNKFNELNEKDDIGVVFITELIAKKISKELKEFRLTHTLPIIVEIPDKNGHIQDHIDFISHLIKRAVGIDIAKKEG